MRSNYNAQTRLTYKFLARCKRNSVTNLEVPFFRPDLKEQEVQEVVETLRSGWLTSGPRVKRFEAAFAGAVGASHAVAVNSCTAALHLAVEALRLKAGQGVLVPTMTFAATAEVVRYLGAIPILVDCDPVTLNLDLHDAARKLFEAKGKGQGAKGENRRSEVRRGVTVTEIVGMMPVHVGGMMMDVAAIRDFAAAHQLWTVEDAAHAFPAAWRAKESDEWQQCGQGTANVTCFSFYANKTITTGEGGMAVTGAEGLAQRMRLMSLHGLSQDAWERYSGGTSWDYKIVAPGYKYNLTDIAAALGIHQLARAETMRRERQQVARFYLDTLADVAEIELPPEDANRIHGWHLFPIKLKLDQLSIDRDQFIEKLKGAGVGCSVHWRPLHLHPYYQDAFGWRPEEFPHATQVWERLVSLPIFPGMRPEEIDQVIGTVKAICKQHGR
jgi:dTDP-4-amino-4,6-dideoxygalactose transaminase